MGWFNRGRDSMTIAAAELRDRLGEESHPIILDVRTGVEFTVEGHIPGALHFPLDRLVDDLRRLDPAKDYVTVCRSGARSGRAQHILQRAGFENVKNMQGGMLGWHGPVVHDGPTRR